MFLAVIQVSNCLEMQGNKTTGQFVLYSCGPYENPVGSVGRGRTIAAFRIAQNSSELTGSPMRRDVLRFLASPTAVNYWLKKLWLEKCGKYGRIELIQLTPSGLLTCAYALRGIAAVCTTEVIVENWERRMRMGDSLAHISNVFNAIPME